MEQPKPKPKRQVTLLDPFPSRKHHPNITHHELGLSIDIQKFDMYYYSKQSSALFQIDFLWDITHDSCEKLLTSPNAKKLLHAHTESSKPFELIIWDAVCCESFLGFVVKFDSPPLILATPAFSPPSLMDFAGNYDNPSYVPLSYSPFISQMNFWERVQNTILYLYQMKPFYFSYIPNENRLAKKVFGSDMPNVQELAKNAAVTLINTHPVLEGVKPLLPSTISIAGFHIDKPKPLEKELQSFLDSATGGAIYFSFGTNLQCEYMKPEQLNIFINVFKEINLKVLWKCGLDIPNLPKNIRLGKWFNQSDVLAHPNVKVYISHSGLMGTQEALYHGVPVLAFSFFIDQHFIAQKLERMGLGIRLIFADLTPATLKHALQRLLTEPRLLVDEVVRVRDSSRIPPGNPVGSAASSYWMARYRTAGQQKPWHMYILLDYANFQEKMKERSAIFQDNPVLPKDQAIYWIEYVLRHPRTDLLRSPAQNMPIYKILLLDVIALFVVIIFCIKKSIHLLIKCLLKLFFKKGKVKRQ